MPPHAPHAVCGVLDGEGVAETVVDVDVTGRHWPIDRQQRSRWLRENVLW
jgi:hypothetical protein